RMRAVAKANRRGCTGDFFLSDDMLNIAQAEPAPFLLDGDPVETQLTHLRPEMTREFVLLVDLRGDRRDLVVGKALCGFADRIGHFAELKIESGLGHVLIS